MPSPRLEKAALVAHVAASVGWLGAVGAFLALAIVGLASPDARNAQAAYLGMDLTASLVILPLAFASLLTGLVQSLGSRWGLFRHYWVLAKLAITVVSTILLVLHMEPIGDLGRAAAEAPLAPGERLPARIQMVVASGLAAAALLAATGLSVFKPRGLTAHGRRKLRESRESAPP